MFEQTHVIYLILFSLIALIVVMYPLRKHTRLLCVIVPAIIIFIWLGYTKIGSFSAWINYQARLQLQQQAQALSVEGTDKILRRMQDHLKNHPNSAQGWYLLGRLYASQHQWELAVQAFHQAVKLDPQNVQAEINEIQTLKALNNQRLTLELRDRLQLILAHYPNQVDVLAMLAIDARLNHDYTGEIRYLEVLLPYVPAGSVEDGMIRKALAAAYVRSGTRSKSKH